MSKSKKTKKPATDLELRGPLHLIQVRVTQDVYRDLQEFAKEEGDLQVGVYARRILFAHVQARKAVEAVRKGD